MVSANETIYGISTKYGIPISELLAINPELENGLKTGQVINIRYDPEAIKRSGISAEGFIIHIVEPEDIDPKILVKKQSFKKAIIHIVKPGETLWSLSKKYNISVDQLRELNDLHIKAGQKLIVGYKEKGTGGSKEEIKQEVLAKEYIMSRTKKEIEEIEEKEEINEIEETGETEKAGDTDNFYIAPVSHYPDSGVLQRVLVIPFDPYLYFSDADDEIAAASNIPRNKVRQIIRRKLNTMIMPPGYETVHLIGGSLEDSVTDLNKIYSSITYNYREIPIDTGTIHEYAPPKKKALPVSIETMKRKFNKTPHSPFSGKFGKMKLESKYFGAKIKDPKFFEYFNKKYKLAYYIFVTQFEINTNYEHCLDRARQDYERNFIAHYSIYNAKGKHIAGSKINIFYNSNSNNIHQIVNDNMPKIANRIIAALPRKGVGE